MSPVRVLLVDDHPVVRDGIRGLIEKAVDIVLIGEAAKGAEALQMIETDPPDVLLLDLELPDIPGVQVAHRVQELYPAVKILVLSAHDDPVYVRELLELGAAGYLMKEEAPESIVDAVRGVAHGEQGWVSRRIAAQMASWMQNDDADSSRLTVREYEVLRWLVQGKTNQAIAEEMNISVKTVEKYIRNIFTKLNVTSRVEAAVYAVKEGLVKS
jgi:DNA-binding NarL/FixJ family response regulator